MLFCFNYFDRKNTISGKEEKQYDIDVKKIFYNKEIVENMGNPSLEETKKEVFSLFEGEWKGCFRCKRQRFFAGKRIVENHYKV